MKRSYSIFSLIILAIYSFTMNENTDKNTIYDFNNQTELSDWRVINDGVMGGISSSSITLDNENNGVFKGDVSTDYNGGFASIRHQFIPMKISDTDSIVLRIKGDGKRYQFRIKHKTSDFYSYIQYFETSGEWQEIKLAIHNFYPSFRGRKLDYPNFDKDSFQEVTFLIANKRDESFALVIDYITLQSDVNQ